MENTDPSDDGGGREADDGRAFRAILREILVMAGGAYLLVLVASVAARYIPFVSGSLYLLVALIFIYLPYWWLQHNGWSFSRFGLTTERLWSGVGWGLGLTVLTAAPFAAGFYVWETEFIGSSYAFEWANFRRWEPELEGHPEHWSEGTGIWTWTRDRAVHVGMRAGSEVPLSIELEGDRSFQLESVGPVRVVPIGESAGADRRRLRHGSAGREEVRSRRWRIELWHKNKRAELTVDPPGAGTSNEPTRLEISIVDHPDAYTVRTGPRASKAGDSFRLDRGFRWIWLWLMTQVAFIALPEEFFYRGYLQTRVGEVMRTYREEASEEGATRTWLGISEQNVIASLAFGVGHLLIPVNGQILVNRVAVAFPSLVFGWLRDRTGTITASVTYHAGCNMLVLLAEPHFF